MLDLKSALSAVIGRFRQWREQQRAYAELSALDDHALADLGLRRSDIPFVVYCKSREEPAPEMLQPALVKSSPSVANANSRRPAAA
jgi:uncharacterized protein YjiS (DUF1127 family)